jgi:hypothetical protein
MSTETSTEDLKVWAEDPENTFSIRHEVLSLLRRLEVERARREQAEKERDEAREHEDAARKHTRIVDTEWAKLFDESEAARKRSEADNAEHAQRVASRLAEVRAAITNECNKTRPSQARLGEWRLVEMVLESLEAPSAGAATLKRLRALEDVARLLVRSGLNCRWVEDGRKIDLRALAADALGGGR